MSLKKALGFEKGYITLFKGDQSLYEDFLKESNARYHCTFKWYVVSTEELPANLPAGLEPVRLEVDRVFNGDTLKPSKELQYNVETLLYGESNSDYYGTIGSRYDLVVKCVYAKTKDGQFGSQTFHIFEDKDGNLFTWSTAARVLDVGTIYSCRATVKSHEIYHSQKQTVLTRAMSFKERTDF